MSILNSLDVTEHLFELWVPLIPKMTFEIELKRSLMGLSTVFVIPPEKLNQVKLSNLLRKLKLILEF